MKSTLGMVLALLTLLELTFSSQVAFAANDITRLVPFQGRLHGGDNKIVSDGTYDLTFYVYETPTGGTSLWTETHPSVSVIHGYVNVLLGAISPMVESNYANQAPLYGEDKNTVNFAEQKYLGISINGGAEMFPRSQLVPTFHAYTANHATHATQADNADNLGGKAANTYSQVSYVNNADSVLNTKIDNSIGDINTVITTKFGEKFNDNKAKDADLLDGKEAADFLLIGAKAVNTDLLDGKDSNDFSQAKGNEYFGNDDSNITTAQFIELLNAKGAFSIPHWVAKGAWSYGGNRNITDTGIISSLELAGSVVEVFTNNNTTYTIRVTGAPAGAAAHRVFEYINHGSSYTPGWKEIVTNKAGKAYDADKFDGLDSTVYARTNIHETFGSSITVNGDTHINYNGGGDAWVHFYDDNSNTWRSMGWDDSKNRMVVEQDNGVFTSVGGGLNQVWSGNATKAYGNWGTGLYYIKVSGGGRSFTSVMILESLNENMETSVGEGAYMIYRANENSWQSSYGNIIRIYKVQTPLGD